MMRRSIDLGIDDLYKYLYFAVLKFEYDPLHRQGTSAKNDMLGGFVDRWINKFSEELVFNRILIPEKDYKVIVDFFIYNNEADKNAPDVLGLTTADNRVIRFAEFRDTTWIPVQNMPWIEVKTCKRSQAMFGIRDSQMDDDHYYIIAEADLIPNYLKAAFKDQVFKSSILDEIKMNDKFIASNPNTLILQPRKIRGHSGDIGSLELIGVFKGKDIKRYGNCCIQGQSPYYLRNIEQIDKLVRGAEYNYQFKLDKYNLYGDPDHIKIRIDNNKNILVKKVNKTTIYIETIGPAAINGTILEPNKYYKLVFAKFERNSSWIEYIAHKNTFDGLQDRSEELIRIFDSLI
ncbi:MAG: hypothetical protein GX944_03210 [Alphaproteobacteria bacterium]|nr:hypothetical protein [Alphaproteobacteria bacterium]